MGETFKYDAFISYRHLEPDQTVAKMLHKELEKFRLPGNIAKQRKNGKTKISRVFRDQEELPLASNLEDPIIEALKQSEWLIVICSPRLQESLWCQKEIETFISLRGIDHVLTVLVEGEPKDSFPEQLLYREYQVTNAMGVTETVREKVEPLAADCRGATDKERRKAVKSESLRLLAPMFGLGYDDLKQRHREQKMKRLVTGVSITAVLGILFGIVCAFAAIRFQQQRDQIKEQADEIENLAMEISEQAEEIEEQNDTLRMNQAESLAQDAMNLLNADDREGALEMAYYALTEYDGIEMPYTPLAHRALIMAAHPYGVSDIRRPLYQIEVEEDVSFCLCNELEDTIIIADRSNTYTCWSAQERQIVWQQTGNEAPEEDLCVFLSDEIFCYADYHCPNIYCFAVDTGEMVCKIETDFDPILLQMDTRTDQLYVFGNYDVVVYDVSDCINGNVNMELSYHLETREYSEGIMMGRSLKPGVVAVAMGNQKVRVIDLNQQNEIRFECEFEEDEVNDIILANNTVYILSTFDGITDTGFVNSYVSLYAYDYSDGSLQWKTDHELWDGEKLYYLRSGTRRRVVVIGTKGVFLCNPDTGEETYKENSDDDIIWSEQLDQDVFYLLETGALGVVGSDDMIMCSNGEIACNVAPYVDAVLVGSAFLIAPCDDNRLIIYAYTSGGVLQSMDDAGFEEVSPTGSGYLSSDEAEKFDIKDSESVSEIVYDDNGEYAMVCFYNGMVRIYRVEDGTIVFEEKFDIHETGYRFLAMDTYLGTDTYGNTYWSDWNVGLCFDPDFNLLGIYPYLTGVDCDNNQLIFGSRYQEERYWAPIYSVEELLELTKEYLLEYHIIS